ncbi:hypothetical protein EAL2_c03410 [Peptoclostridium acidaminophilum DSM 3953]|uniref:Uncharacterized protein n=1 Tax=Peptoclostridium acidaminophilum DSM 3953 TaxID=1286171 RepID=W8T1Q7_PEPAC|nr:hypothetical protein EAL2_c03410 [Peptoclostridium acidaminophilum DSM 3953]
MAENGCCALFIFCLEIFLVRGFTKMELGDILTVITVLIIIIQLMRKE